MIIVGHGARYDMDAIVAFAESLNRPVLTTFKRSGSSPAITPWAVACWAGAAPPSRVTDAHDGPNLVEVMTEPRPI